MSKHMPTTAQVRKEYVTGRIRRAEVTSPEASRSFQRWLTAHDREVAAEAWTEGFDRGFYRGQVLHGDYDACEAGIPNPYRDKETNE